MFRSVFMLLVLVGLLGACGLTKEGIKAQIAAAQHCEKDSDCVDIGSQCPFGCHIVVHKDHEKQIKALVKSYPSNCMYDCIALERIVCEAQRCKAIMQR